MPSESCIVWFRQDLRLDDNPALQAALKTGLPIYCIFIWDETMPALVQPGGASQWWLHQSLTKLNEALCKRGNKLLLYRGNPQDILLELIRTTNAKCVYWNRCYDMHSIQRDKNIKKVLLEDNIDAQSFNSHLLFEPWKILSQTGHPYKVFTPFWKKAFLTYSTQLPRTHIAAKKILCAESFPRSESLSDWQLLPTKPDWAKAFVKYWHPGEAGAYQRLDDFINHGLSDYKEGRNFPAQQNVSGLSPHLHWGEIAPWRIWHALETASRSDKKLSTANVENFQRELGWREFSYHLLYHFPSLPTENFRKEFDNFSWITNKKALKAWQQGQTGYPLIDAGMRQLWQTGWMHNRVRMVVGSFLVKDLRLHWQQGAQWFWDTLVDADLASNSASWQWVAGCGADAAPYFRIFNPLTQSEKFDANGEYIRRWVPELAHLDNKSIHCPWKVAPEILKKAGVVLGESYPRPIVDHSEARVAALAAFKKLK